MKVLEEWLSLATVQTAFAYANDKDIDLTGFKKFINAYESAGGDPTKLSEAMLELRDEEVVKWARQQRGRPIFHERNPSKPHLRMILFAASPNPGKAHLWAQSYLSNRRERWKKRVRNPFR